MPGRVVSRRFIGREPDLARFGAALEASAQGRATTVLVPASAGMGATRFIAEGVERANLGRNPPLVLRGRSHGPLDPPWAAVLAAIRPLLTTRPGDEVARLLGSVARGPLSGLPELAPLVAASAGPPASELEDPERRQPRAIEPLLRWLGRIAVEQPVVIVLEDLHCADAATRAFATFVSRSAREHRITLVLSYQPDRLLREHALRQNLGEIEASPRPPVRIELGPLDRREVARLIEGIEGERPSASIVVLVAERSAGSPVVVEELLAARRDLQSSSLTGTLNDIVTARLAERSAECRRLLRLVAPAERPVTRARLADTAAAYEEAVAQERGPRGLHAGPTRPPHGTGTLDRDLAAGLDEALEHGLVRMEDDDVVEMRHEVLAHAVVADLLPPQRPRYRAALAQAFADIPIVAAAHWKAANRVVQARAAAITAGEVAEACMAPEDALTAYELALGLPEQAADGTGSPSGPVPDGPGPSEPEPPSLADLYRRAAEVALAARRPTRAVAYAEAALGWLGERRNRQEHAVLEAKLGRYRLAAGDGDGATKALRRAVEMSGPTASLERVRILALFAQERMIDGAFRDSERAALDALELCRELGEDATPEAIHATITLGALGGWGGDPEGAIDRLREALERSSALGLVDERFRAAANLTTILELVGRPQEAIDVALRGMQQAAAEDLEAVYGNLIAGNVAGVLVDVGRWREARELCLRALDWTPAPVSVVNALGDLVFVEVESNAGEEAGRLLGRILVELETGRDSQFAVPAYQATASYALWSGDLADARRAAERGWARLRKTEDWVLVTRMAATMLEVESALVAEALEKRRLGDLAAARERAGRVLAEAEGAVRRVGLAESVVSRREPDANLATVRAFHARVHGRDDPAAWDDLAQRWHELGDPYREARGRWHQVEAIMAAATAGGAGRDGSRSDARAVRLDAREPLSQAVELALGLGARPLLRELRALAERARIPLPAEVDAALAEVPAAVPLRTVVTAGPVVDAHAEAVPAALLASANDGDGQGDTFGLSRRELEVLAQISKGRTNREIGDRLFISEKTVGVHVGKILSKLGVSGRVEAATVAIRLQLEA